MTALRNFHQADGRTWRERRRAASAPCRHERCPRRPPAARIDSRPAAGRPWVVARTLRAGAAALLALWAIVALAFCGAVAVALVR